MKFIRPANKGFTVETEGFEPTEYLNEEVNLDLVIGFSKFTFMNEGFPIYKINFKTMGKPESWYFKDELERDSTLFKIKASLKCQVI